MFGRGGEEAEALAEAGIPFEVVPGVSALSAVPASAGIPVTHRGVSAQVTLVSGHSASGDDLDFAQLAAAPGTLVVFMGLAHLGEIAGGLIAAGKDPRTPAAVVSRGTLPDGRSVSGELGEVAAWPLGCESPALLVVGEVVAVGEPPLGRATFCSAARRCRTAPGSPPRRPRSGPRAAASERRRRGR